MYILSHRGFWLSPNEKNLEIAFRRSFEAGFGVETDIRDYQGRLVIAHDIASKEDMDFDYFINNNNKINIANR